MLSSVGNVLVGLVGLIHVFIFNLESLKWYRGAAKGFGVKKEHYPTTAVFAANQGKQSDLRVSDEAGWKYHAFFNLPH